jgi:hypothetical protein
MVKKSMKAMSKAASKVKRQPMTGGAVKRRGVCPVRLALRAVSTELKSERVDLAVLFFGDRLLMIGQAQFPESRLQELTSNVLALPSALG